MSTAARLAELGVELPVVVAPVAAYVPALRHGGVVHVSGQLPLVNGELSATGKVGVDVTPEQAHDLARICALNGLAAAADAVGGVDNLTGVVKLVVFVNSAPEIGRASCRERGE